MDSKKAIMQATIELIEVKGDHIEEITVREICKKAGVGLGLVNYHFENKDKLIEECVECIINGIIDRFQTIREKTEGLSPFDKLDYLGTMTLEYLFEHEAVARISILADMKTSKESDNTNRTYIAYLPLFRACRPDWDEETIKRKTLYLISVMQHILLRHEILSQVLGIDLKKKENRRVLHTQVLHDILEV